MKKSWVVAQNLQKKNPTELKEYGEEVVAMVTASPYFNMPNPAPNDPPLMTISTDIATLDAAISAIGGGVTKTDAIREAANTVENDLNQLGLFVQIAANRPVNKPIGDVIIHAAGMEYRRAALPKARVFAVMNSPVQQTDIIARTVKGGSRAAYEWQVKKANEATWPAGTITLQATFTFTGLLPGTRYQFRVRTVTKNTNNLSNVLELVVL